MKTFALIAVVALGLAAVANAECANACSGHGTCGQNDECACFPNWMASDCSERVCPYGLAFVDTPRGDLNHNGIRDGPDSREGLVSTMRSNALDWEQFPPTAAELTAIDALAADFDAKYGSGNYILGQVSKPNEAHFYTECSAKGVCDRELGLCQCFDGYSGSSCQRTVCPNDCSGHGVCRTVEEIAAGGLNYKKTNSAGGVNYFSGMALGSELSYRLWDHDKSQACVCDAGYSGADCSRRECPRGDDPLTFRQAECGGAASCSAERQVFTLTSTAGPFVEWRTLSFRDWTGETWRTDYFPIGTDGSPGCVAASGTFADTVAAQLKSSLESIPNAVFSDVDVTVVRTSNLVLTVTFDFNGNPGNIASLDWSVPATAQVDRGMHTQCTATTANAAGVVSISTDDSGVITATGHGLSVGDLIFLDLVVGSHPMNGYFTVDTAPDANTFTIADADGNQVLDGGAASSAGDIFTTGATVASNGNNADGDGVSAVALASNTNGNREESTCSNRGLCDYETGLCKCFRGYYKGDCSSQNALAGAVSSAL